MMAFFAPLKLGINSIPTTVFIDEGTEQVLTPTRQSLKSHLQQLYDSGNVDAEYCIVFIRKDGDDCMTDLWIFTKVGERPSGPLCDVQIYRNHAREHTIGVGSGNTLLVLGLEEQRRRDAGDFKKYLQGAIILPDELALGRDFY